MRRLMLDYFRRWWWVLALAGLGEFWLGWRIANRPQDPIEFFVLLATMWAGASPLSFDFRGGALRPIAVLPLAARDIGRGWWLATVPIPAVALTALLFLGAGACCLHHPGLPLPAERLGMMSLFTIAWLGLQFTLAFSALHGVGRTPGEFVRIGLINLLSMLMLFGSMLVCQGAASSPLRAAFILGGGGLLTVVGWFRAEQFEPGRAGQAPLGGLRRLVRGRPDVSPAPPGPRTPPGQFQPTAGYGGVPFLLWTMFVRIFLLIAALAGVMTLIWLLQRLVTPQHTSLVAFAQMENFMAGAFAVVFQLLPVARHLRLLRTLPISTTRLAAVMMAMTVLPPLTLGVVAAGVAGLALGTPTALMVLNFCIFNLAPVALCVSVILWRGDERLAYVLLCLNLFGSQVVYAGLEMSLRSLAVPLTVVGPIAAVGVLASFLLAWLALSRGSRAYRVRAIPLEGSPWGLGR